MPNQTQIDTQPQSVDLILRLHRLEGSTQAAPATLRRYLIEKVPPTRDGLAHEAAMAFQRVGRLPTVKTARPTAT